ncbi:unnamed protein product [Cylicocyclus nassatus]|uniref:Uncharacterized protein n=1 Tax=Cylicocyclus nassatus TaxID=53992 RepID=A0AA36H185_CYLNA|nr:unnamed protein product [Cylicocyclus nassatus]
MKRVILIAVAVSLICAAAQSGSDEKLCAQSDISNREADEIVFLLNRNRSAKNLGDIRSGCLLFASSMVRKCASPEETCAELALGSGLVSNLNTRANSHGKTFLLEMLSRE